jgi:hypothetical protein
MPRVSLPHRTALIASMRAATPPLQTYFIRSTQKRLLFIDSRVRRAE